MKTSLIIAFLAAFALSILLGPIIIPLLRRIKAGQTERDDGPKEHLKKNGTPTMGAFIFLISAGIVSAFFIKDCPKIVPVLLLTLGFMAVGFIDDFIKVVLKRSMGLRAWQKFSLQIVVALVFALYINCGGVFSFDAYVPFAGDKTVNFEWFNIPLCIFIIVGTVNGSNFTDGVDGLETTVTAAILTFLFVCALGLESGMEVLPVIFVGALLGFLMFNVNKAKVFMGDTGSLALGGLVAGLSYALSLELYLPFFAIIYFAEVLSVIIQVLYFKATHGKRFFKMAPIHHHFELSGFSEAKVVAVFATVTVMICAFMLIFIPTVTF